MITLPVTITAMIVTMSMGMFMSAVVMLCFAPLVQAMMGKRKPELPPFAPILENLGLTVALAGLTFRVTEVAAVGLGLAIAGYIYGRAKATSYTHPVFETVVAVCGVIGVGALAEFYYVMG